MMPSRACCPRSCISLLMLPPLPTNHLCSSSWPSRRGRANGKRSRNNKPFLLQMELGACPRQKMLSPHIIVHGLNSPTYISLHVMQMSHAIGS